MNSYLKKILDRLPGLFKKFPTQASNAGTGKRLQSVGAKLFLVFFCSIVFFVMLVGLLSYSLSKSIIKDEVSGASKNTIVQTAGKIDLMFQQYEQLTLSIMLDKDLRNSIIKVGQSNLSDFEKMTVQREIEQKMQSYIFANKTLSAVTILSTIDGGMDVSSAGNVDPKVKDSDWYKKIIEAKGKAVWVNTTTKGVGSFVNGFPNEPSFVVGRVLTDVLTNKPYGVLVINIKHNTLAKVLKEIQLSENSTVYMIDSSDSITAFEDEKFVGQSFATPIDKKKKMDATEYKDENGDNKLVVYSQTPTTGWFLVGTLPVSDLLVKANRIFIVTLIVAAIAAVLAVIIGFFVVRMIGKPLAELRNLMKQGEEGNLKVRTNFRRKDEIGQLGESFNQMMEQISLLAQHTNSSAQVVFENASELSNASKKTALSAKEISLATEEIATGASTLAVEAERGNDLTVLIGQQMKQVVDANLKMGMTASEVDKVSQQGIVYMSELIDKTNSTEEMTRSMVEKVDRLKESTTSIQKILEVLNNMTKQTNILSLNATIEAARAGAAGKGFMVVADEIRKLADQSRQSIDVVAQITETIQLEIDETVAVLSKAYPVFKEQISSVKEADLIFKDVKNHMGQFIGQLDGVTSSIQSLEESQETLSAAMGSVSAVSQQSSATSEEVASLSNEQQRVSEGLVQLSEKLEDLSNSLKDSLSRFTV